MIVFWPLWLYLIFEVVLVIIFLSWLHGDLKKIWCWLKGSRTSYYIDTDGDRTCSLLLCTTRERRATLLRYWPVIEIGRGLFRWSSKIYGQAYPDHWKIIGNDDRAGHWVQLTDRFGLPVENALCMINTYPSLQAMLDRITELEGKFVDSERQRKDMWAAIRAVLRVIDLDRNQYRSKTSERIRGWLEWIDRSASPAEGWPPTDRTQQFVDAFTGASPDVILKC